VIQLFFCLILFLDQYSKTFVLSTLIAYSQEKA